ncbi:MAG TPA: maleylpyruvate isomerase family mycothiol-dependent enzyme [Acidimicrobiia bacterium]
MLVSPRYDGPPIISITGRPGDQLAPVLRQRRRLEAMLVDLDDADWSSASRCDDWTVQDVVAHMVGVNTFWNASVRAGLGGTPTRLLVGFDPATTPALMVDAMRDLAPQEILDQFVTSNETFLGVLAQLDDTGWTTLAESPAGHVPIRMVAHHALWDCWIHERDIALPLGLNPPLEPDEVASCLRYAAALSPALAIGTGHLLGGRFAVEATDPSLSCLLDVGESVTVRDGRAPPEVPCLRGEAVPLVEALSIRTPMPASVPPEWLRLLGGLAAAFTADAPLPRSPRPR